MSLVNCRECGNEISTKATSCPNCGFVIQRDPPVAVARVFPINEESTIPKWVVIPAITIVALVGIIGFVMLRNQEDATGKNINVSLSNANKNTRTIDPQSVRTADSNPPSQVTVPSSSTAVNPPARPPVQELPKTQQTVPSSQTEEVKTPSLNTGTVRLNAKVITKSGESFPVKNERFYLLDEEVESILDKSDLEPIESNSLTNSLGLSMIYPERYGQFNRKAMEAIRKHSKYNVSTDENGKASMTDIKPTNYYLFGITNSKTGFALWNSSVMVNVGDNILTLAPAQFNDVVE